LVATEREQTTPRTQPTHTQLRRNTISGSKISVLAALRHIETRALGVISPAVETVVTAVRWLAAFRATNTLTGLEVRQVVGVDVHCRDPALSPARLGEKCSAGCPITGRPALLLGGSSALSSLAGLSLLFMEIVASPFPPFVRSLDTAGDVGIDRRDDDLA
jgi:hypothetical protein